MATVNPEITDPDMRAFLGLPPIGSDPLEAFLEQALDPIARQNIDLSQYLQGVQTDPYGITNNNAINTNLGAANDVLSRLYADNPSAFRGGGFTPWGSFADWNARQNTREGFNEGSDLGSFISGGISHLGDTASELWAEPGVKALLAAGTAGAYMGGGLGGGAAAGGTAGTDVAAGAGYDAFAANDPLGFMLQQAEGFGVPGELTAAAEMAGYPSVEAYLGAVNPAWAAAGGAALGGTAGSALGGAASAAGAGSLLSGLGDVLKGAKGYLPSGNTAAALAPIIAAIAYAKNQGPFDTSRLTSTYDQFQPDALAYEFDQNTNAGRNALTSSLTNRGVMGSSFGNMDLTNFQTTRDLGRRSLVNQGLAARGGLANNILEAQFKERQLKNQLYGTSLLALGNVFGGRNQPTAGV